MMKGTKKSKPQDKQQPGDNVAEKALLIAIENTVIDKHTIKALRLTCKRTKMAADARVKKFTLFIDIDVDEDEDESQDTGHVQRSGLLRSIRKLCTQFCLRPFGDPHPKDAQNIAQALVLLNLAMDVCSKSLEVLEIDPFAYYENLLECAQILAGPDWESLKELTMLYPSTLSALLSSVLARPDCLPVLKKLHCRHPSSADIELLHNAAFVGNLTDLSLTWCSLSSDTSQAPATVTAMRSLLQKASSLERLDVSSRTFEFFDSGNLVSLTLKSLSVHTTLDGTVDFGPVLAWRWPKLQSLHISGMGYDATMEEPYLERIFEAEDTLPLLQKVTIAFSSFIVDVPLSCVRRPHLKEFSLDRCRNGHILLSKLVQLMKEDIQALPSVRAFNVDCKFESPIASALEAISDLLSCPQMAALETLAIRNANIGEEGLVVLGIIARYCTKLKILDLRDNKMGRPAVALIAGSRQHFGAWPELKRLGMSGQATNAAAAAAAADRRAQLNSIRAEHYLQELDLQATLESVWPGLEYLPRFV